MSDSYLLTGNIFQEDLSVTVTVGEERQRCELEVDLKKQKTYCHAPEIHAGKHQLSLP